jgi:hypothetical protein
VSPQKNVTREILVGNCRKSTYNTKTRFAFDNGTDFGPERLSAFNYKDVEKQASGRQPPVNWPLDFTGRARRAAFWKAPHIQRYVSIYNSRTTPDHGRKARFFNTLLSQKGP